MHLLTEKELASFANANSYSEAYAVALAHVRRRVEAGETLVQVCGPISTGGLNDRAKNIARLREVMDIVRGYGYGVFDQTNFEGMVARFSPNHGPQAYDHRILTEFYRPLLAQGYISMLVMVSGWEDSRGAQMEYALGKAFNLEVLELHELAWRHPEA